MDLSILSLLAQATLVAKAVLVVLLFMSVFSWALMFRKWMNIRAALKKAADGMDRFNHARDLREAVQSLGGDPDSPLYTVAHEGVTEFNRSKEAGNSEDVVVDNVRRALRQGVDMEMTRLTSSLSFLATSANTAPFIGLFGTVWGIMNTFHAIGAMKSASLATVAPGISGAWAVDDVVTWWMPYGPAIGNELENADSVIRIDGTAGKMRSCTIKFSTPTEFTDELGDHFPGQPIDTMRASSVDFEYYMRNDAAKRLREGSEGKEVRFDAEFGSEEGRKLVVSCPRIKNKMPAINADSATVTLSQSSDILGVALEDAVEIILE